MPHSQTASMIGAARDPWRIVVLVCGCVLGGTALAAAQRAPRIRRVALAEIEKRIDRKTLLPCFVLLDENITDPQSQIVVSVSATPDSMQRGLLLSVWLVDTAGSSVKVKANGRDTIMAWELEITSDSTFHDVDWQVLRPSRPGRGIFKLRVRLETSKTPQDTRPFVLQPSECDP